MGSQRKDNKAVKIPMMDFGRFIFDLGIRKLDSKKVQISDWKIWTLSEYLQDT